MVLLFFFSFFSICQLQTPHDLLLLKQQRTAVWNSDFHLSEVSLLCSYHTELKKRKVVMPYMWCLLLYLVLQLGNWLWLTNAPGNGRQQQQARAQSVNALFSIIRPAFSSFMSDCVQLKCVPISGQIAPSHFCYGDKALCVCCGAAVKAIVWWCEAVCYFGQTLLEGNSLRDAHERYESHQLLPMAP